jgi:hypothetical protein
MGSGSLWKTAPGVPTAAVKAINAIGGINGAKNDMTFCDSKSDPNMTTASVKKAISGHDAAVIVPTSSVGQGGADQLWRRRVVPGLLCDSQQHPVGGCGLADVRGNRCGLRQR